LWDELMHRNYEGVEEVEKKSARWEQLKEKLPPEIFENVRGRLQIQVKEALWWRDACYLYFREFSGLPLPKGRVPLIEA